MIKPDLIVCQPSHVDYPLFRYNLKRFRRYFENVYITLTQDSITPDLRPFLIETMQDVTFVRPPEAADRPDWRDRAVREVLINFSKSEWVLFMEQDFLIKDASFFEKVLNTQEHDAVLYMEGPRIHPAFALVRRAVVGRTSMDFAANPPKYDHFGLFFKQLADSCTWMELEDARLVEKDDFYHLAGLTQNYYCFLNNQPLFKPKEFLTYNHYAIRLPIVHNTSFRELGKRIDASYEYDLTYIRDFFPYDL